MTLPYYERKKPSSFLSKSLPIIFLIVGTLFLGLTVYLYNSQYQFMSHAKTTTGKVVGYDTPKGKNLKRPIIEYTTPDQKKHTYYHPEGTNPPTHKIGDKVKVYYNPVDNEEASLGYRFILLGILSFIGLIFMGIGIGMKT